MPKKYGMPVYEYRCKECGTTHEFEHGFYDERPTQCPSCGGPLVRVFHPIGVLFKGSGFHKTDYGAAGGAKKEAPASEPKPEKSKADTKPSDGKTASSETKPAAKSPGK